jgi:hypothetical protein
MSARGAAQQLAELDEGGVRDPTLHDEGSLSMDTSPQHDSQRQSCCPATGPHRLALWKVAQKQLHGKLDPHEVAKMREEWAQTYLAKR